MQHNSPRDRALARAESGRLISASLKDALVIANRSRSNHEEISIHAHRIASCNADRNIWLATDMHDPDGVAFDGTGRFWNCGSKLCPACLARQTKRNRANLTAALQLQRLRVGEHYGMITLTLPHEGLPLWECRSIMLTAWQLFRKRKWFKDTIIGASRSEEFTLTRRGYNYHQHLLTRSKYVSYHMLRSEWTHCISVAFERHERSLTIATADNLAVAHYRRVTSIRSAVNEVAKYVTKSSSWKQLTPDDLLDIASIARFPRMFELVGSFKRKLMDHHVKAWRRLEAQTSGGPSLDEGDCGEDEDYLDTTSLTDGDTCPGWRGKLRSIGVAAYLDDLEDEIVEKSAFRMEQLHYRYPAATFRRLKSPPMPAAKAILDFIDATTSNCPDCHRPMIDHDRSKIFANACTLIIR